MEHRVIETPEGITTIFNDRDFTELIEKHISHDAAKYYEDRIEELKNELTEFLNEVGEIVKEIRKEIEN